jgi:hypothetical protein
LSTHAALVSFPLSSLCRSIKLSCERRELMAAKRMQVSSCRTVLRRSCPGSSAASGRERTVRHLALQQNKRPRIVSCRAPPAPDLRPADPLDSAGTHTRTYVVTHRERERETQSTRCVHAIRAVFLTYPIAIWSIRPRWFEPLSSLIPTGSGTHTSARHHCHVITRGRA